MQNVPPINCIYNRRHHSVSGRDHVADIQSRDNYHMNQWTDNVEVSLQTSI